ncbi:MAG: OadG family protein [Lachnospiraceae bacterium]|jgi:sodium pump decarboxylase gamma subunit|uniref:OadG family protein n=1 Tax=Candidatus Merdisoma sp. JLR.KK006 TaxID=3112626 RepID=UPI002FF3FC37|nr:OadG family protein [Lachnospiraceae bacterium]
MKRNMKKLISLLALLVCVISLAGCAARKELPKEEMYRNKSDQYVKMLTSMSEEELNELIAGLEEEFEDFEQEVALYRYIGGTGQKFDFTADAYLALFKSYASNLDDFGAYVGVKEYEGGVEKDGEVTYDVVYEFEKHDMRLSLVYDSHDVVITVTADPIYSTGEILQKAGMNTLLGMGVVFTVLILISLIISCFNFIPAIEKKFSKKKAEEKKAAAPAAPVAAAPVAAPAAEEPADDLELVAVITAAVAAAMGTTSTDGFVVRSIKRKSNQKWKKA